MPNVRVVYIFESKMNPSNGDDDDSDFEGLENTKCDNIAAEKVEATVVIKTEPLDDEPAVSEQPKRQKLSHQEYLARNPIAAVRSQARAPTISDGHPGVSLVPPGFVPQFSISPQPGPSGIRDPRLQRVGGPDPRLQNGNRPDPRQQQGVTGIDQMRQAFLNSQLKANDILQATQKVAGYPTTPNLRTAYQVAREGHERLTQFDPSTIPKTFHAVVPPGSLRAGGYDQKRSPLIASNHHAIFVSQATSTNIEDAYVGQRYRSIPRDLQQMGQQLGVDLDRIASTGAPVAPVVQEGGRRGTTETSFASNTRTVGCQARPPGEEKETQTTKNTEGLEIYIPDVRALNQEQRDAAQVLKKFTGTVDEPSTASMRERLDHRRAREHFNRHFQGNSDLASSPASANPPPLVNAGPPRSKYANAIPK